MSDDRKENVFLNRQAEVLEMARLIDEHLSMFGEQYVGFGLIVRTKPKTIYVSNLQPELFIAQLRQLIDEIEDDTRCEMEKMTPHWTQ